MTGFVDPNGDGSTVQWTCSTGTSHFAIVNKAVRQPSTPSTSSYTQGSSGTTVDEFAMSTFTVSAVSQIKIWVYQNGGGTVSNSCQIFVGGAWSSAQSVSVASTSWQNVTFTGTWTQSDLDALQVRLTAIAGGGGVQVYEMYAEVTYTAAAAAGSFAPLKIYSADSPLPDAAPILVFGPPIHLVPPSRPFSRPLNVFVAENTDAPPAEGFRILVPLPPPPTPRPFSRPLWVITAESTDVPDPEMLWLMPPPFRLPPSFRTRPPAIWCAREDSPLITQPASVILFRPPPVLVLQVTARAAGIYRVADPTLDRYELYRGVDAAPDFTGSPYATFTTLPHTTAAQAAGHAYHLVLRKRDAWNLLSQNARETVIDLSVTGTQNPEAPSDPIDIVLAPAAGGTISIAANYLYDLDAPPLNSPADSFLVYVRTDGSDPDVSIDTPTIVPMLFGDGVAALIYATSAQLEGTLVKAIVRTRRTGSPNVDSIGTTVYAATATLLGPGAVNAGAYLGDAAQQIQ